MNRVSASLAYLWRAIQLCHLVSLRVRLAFGIAGHISGVRVIGWILELTVTGVNTQDRFLVL
jgi:hypothetical protein